MPEQPENPFSEPRPAAPLWKRVRALALIVFLYAITVAMAGAAIALIIRIFRPGTPPEDRLTFLMIAPALLVIPGGVAWKYLRTKWTTGRWFMTREKSAQVLVQCSTQKFSSTQAPPWGWILFAVHWANYAARDPDAPLAKRVLGWTMLVLVIAALLGVTGLGVIFIGAGIDTIHSVGPIMVIVGALILLFPALAARSLRRRVRSTGSWRTSQDELGQMVAQRNEWRIRENRKSLRAKIISTVITVAIITVWWMREAMRHARHEHYDWFNPTLWTVFAIYAIWIQFRKPKSSAPPSSNASPVTQI
jgi:ABC-type multidrug transport system fused ATPase/permease subunit